MSWSPQFKPSVSDCPENDAFTCQSTRQNTTSSSSSTLVITGDQQLVDNTATTTTTTTNCIPTLSPQTQIIVADVEEIPTTPTMPCNRIPQIGACPPAPSKSKSRPTLKRKLLLHSDHQYDCLPSININTNNNVDTNSSNNVTRLLDFSKEVESMFPPPIQLNFRRKIKKARSI